MAKKDFPEFHKALLDHRNYPSAKRRIKYEETRSSGLYKTGEFVYQVRKPSRGYDSPALKEVLAHETLAVGKRWAPEVYHEVVPIVRIGGEFALAADGEAVDYALKLTQLSDHYWADKLMEQGNLTPTAVGRVARYLADQHALYHAEGKAAEAGRPEHFQEVFEEVVYQVRKFVDRTAPQALLDMVTHPVAKFVDDNRKLFLRRQKKGFIVECHGDFVLEHIYIKGKETFAVFPLARQDKFRVLDAANDVATLLNEFIRRNDPETGQLFLKRYMVCAKDREVSRLIPAYQTLQAMRSGLILSEQMSAEGLSEAERSARAKAAQTYFQIAVQAAREIPRE